MASIPFIESRGNPIIVPTESLAWRLSIMIYFTTTTASTQNTLCYTLIPKKPSSVVSWSKGIKKPLWKCRQKTTMRGLRTSFCRSYSTVVISVLLLLSCQQKIILKSLKNINDRLFDLICVYSRHHIRTLPLNHTKQLV